MGSDEIEKEEKANANLFHTSSEKNNNGRASSSSPSSPPSSRNGGTGLTGMLLMMLSLCSFLSISVNLMHSDSFEHHHPDTPLARAMKDFKRHAKSFKKPKKNNENQKMDGPAAETKEGEEEPAAVNEEDGDKIHDAEEEHHLSHEEMIERANGKMKDAPTDDTVSSSSFAAATMPKSTIAGLSCQKYGGPDSPEAANEVVYWHDIPSDQEYVSPFLQTRSGKQHRHRRQYMTFEPDGGGWNNIRMAMETVVGLAVAMGRTLVLPPAQGMYLLRKDKNKQNTDFSFADFFPMHAMAEENRGIDIITMQEFLETEMGNFRDKNTGEPSFPPDNRTNWNGQDVKPFKEWLRNVTYIEHMWRPEDCIAAFPSSGDHKDVVTLNRIHEELVKEGVVKESNRFVGHPVPVDGPVKDRLHENIHAREKLCVYDEVMQQQLSVHFMCYHKMRIRYLTHFYAFLFFENWKQDLWMKRLMRDHMRYIDEIQCAAARIVEAVRKRAKARGWTGGSFDTMHIRRGDFQYKDTRIEATEILKNSQDVLTENKTVYIATDERDKKFFIPLKQRYDVVFLDDFAPLLKDVNTNYYGMIDQIVSTKGDVFLGCFHSTFTGYIMRMRGYHSTKRQLAGFEQGILPTSYYYVKKQHKFIMHEYKPLQGAMFNREFPTSWRDIDKSVGIMMES